MTVADRVADIESRLKNAGKSVSDLCEAAKVSRSTWTRWKAEVTAPNFSTWLKIESACDQLCAPATPQEDAA